jgi:hypothetical protein
MPGACVRWSPRVMLKITLVVLFQLLIACRGSSPATLQHPTQPRLTTDQKLRALLPLMMKDRAFVRSRGIPNNMEVWLRSHVPERSAVVQVGANDHTQRYDSHRDPVPLCVELGWKALLFEPIPSLFAALRARYPAATYRRVSIEQKAICGSCKEGTRQIWRLDTSNNTGSWGSNYSDGRCASNGQLAWSCLVLLRHAVWFCSVTPFGFAPPRRFFLLRDFVMEFVDR